MTPDESPRPAGRPVAGINRQPAMKLLKSAGLISGTIVALVTGFPGLMFCVVTWIILSGLFLISRFAKSACCFTDWSWFQFLVTIGGALGIPYVALLLSPGF